ncbi:MAG: hypothetical protein HC913_09175 [Microscillaceae bacterium]|nr:hypothetical protein [Microscillaceae bacterium]
MIVFLVQLNKASLGYGQASDSRVVYALPTTLKKIPENFKCTVLVSQGHKKDYVSLPYPCKTTLKEND